MAVAAGRALRRHPARLLFVFLRGMENDIYFQIGLVVLIGLAAKNAILIARGPPFDAEAWRRARQRGGLSGARRGTPRIAFPPRSS